MLLQVYLREALHYGMRGFDGLLQSELLQKLNEVDTL